MNYFPVFFDLNGQKVLIVGGGEVALRKVSLLERAGAKITLVAPQIVPELMQRAATGSLKLAIREFIPSDLDDARLVIVATSRRAVPRRTTFLVASTARDPGSRSTLFGATTATMAAVPASRTIATPSS